MDVKQGETSKAIRLNFDNLRVSVFLMKRRNFYPGLLVAVVVALMPVQASAVSAIATINVTIARFLSITNTSSLEFGTVSVSSTAGSVVVDINGMRFTSGGVTISPSGVFSPAKFVIQGKPDANFSVSLPNKVELRDSNGNTIEVDNFQANHATGNLDANGTLELKIGGKINLDANQKSGDYSGVMIVELDYS